MSLSANATNVLRTALGSPSAASEISPLLDKTADMFGSTGTTTAPRVAVSSSATATLVSSVNGLNLYEIKQTITTTNAVQNDLTNTVPAGAVIIYAAANLDTAITGDGSGDDLGVKVGLGVTADPDKYGLSSGLTKNLKIGGGQSWTVLGSAEQLTVKLAKTDGSACTEKFTAGGSVSVRVLYYTFTAVPNA